MVKSDRKLVLPMLKTNDLNHSLTRLIAFAALTALLTLAALAGIVPEAFAYNVFVAPSVQQVQQGGSATFHVSVALEQPEYCIDCPTITLQALPSMPYFNVSFSRIRYTFSYQDYTFESTMTVYTFSLTPPGTYQITITAISANPSGQKSTTVTLIVVGATPPPVFDFSLTISPSTVSIMQGETAHYTILVRYSDPSYAGTVINIQLTGLGSGMTWTSTQTGDLTIVTSPSTPTGAYTIVLVGSALGVTHQTSALLTVNPRAPQFDFSVSVSPQAQTVSLGDETTYSVTVNLVSGSSQLVTLSLSGEPGGITGAFSPSSGSPSFSSSLTLAVSSSASPGSYSMTITGTGGGRTHTATITLIVSETRDFRVEAAPASRTANQGETVSYSISVIGLHGFNSQVSLSATGIPAGATYVFSIPSGTPDFTSVLTVTLPSNVQTGTFTIAIKGSGGGLERYVNIVLVISPGATQTQTPTLTATTTQTQTQTATATQTATTQTPDLLDILQQNSPLLLGGLLVLVVIGAVALRQRSKPPPPPGNPCPTCNKPMTFIKEYDRWYCQNCKEYK
ncbi:COG1470 family protein [[Eubacterium] cellulosolvens]